MRMFVSDSSSMIINPAHIIWIGQVVSEFGPSTYSITFKRGNTITINQAVYTELTDFMSATGRI